MSKSLFLLALGTLVTFAACEKKEEAKKDGVQVEAAKEAPVAVPAPAVPAPATPSAVTTPAAAHEATPAPATKS